MVLPCSLIWAQDEWPSLWNHRLLSLILFSFIWFLLHVDVKGVRHPFIIFEQSSPGESLDSGRHLSILEISILLFIHSLNQVSRQNVVWQISQRLVVSNSETLCNDLLFFVSEVIQKLSQIWQFIVVDIAVNRDHICVSLWAWHRRWHYIASLQILGRLSRKVSSMSGVVIGTHFDLSEFIYIYILNL